MMEKPSNIIPSKLAILLLIPTTWEEEVTDFRHTCVEYSESTKNGGNFAIFNNISIDSFAVYTSKVKIVIVKSLDDW
jgi:hypothetical protein